MAKLIERNGIVGLADMANSLMVDLEANGFNLHYPTAAGGGLTGTTSTATLSAGADVDPLVSDPVQPGDQPWRIRIEATDDYVKFNLGTELQLDDGGFATNDGSDLNTHQALVDANLVVDKVHDTSGVAVPSPVITVRQSTSGHLDGPDSTLGIEQATDEFPLFQKDLFYPPSGSATFDPAAAPISYHLSISDHGIAFMAWVEGGDSVGHSFSWFVVQRPVDNSNGDILITGKCPVFAIWSGGGGGEAISDEYDREVVDVDPYKYIQSIREQRGKIWRMTVREIDINRPTPPVSATEHSEDSHAIINASKQVAISENNQYIITFPSGLNTNRYVYKDELDMMAYTSADVISQYSDVALTVYGEVTPRKYRAMNANGKFNTGMRVLFLAEGGSIPPNP